VGSDMGLVGHVTLMEGLRYLSWSGDAMAEVEVDAEDSAGQWWMYPPHAHARVGQ